MSRLFSYCESRGGGGCKQPLSLQSFLLFKKDWRLGIFHHLLGGSSDIYELLNLSTSDPSLSHSFPIPTKTSRVPQHGNNTETSLISSRILHSSVLFITEQCNITAATMAPKFKVLLIPMVRTVFFYKKCVCMYYVCGCI